MNWIVPLYNKGIILLLILITGLSCQSKVESGSDYHFIVMDKADTLGNDYVYNFGKYNFYSSENADKVIYNTDYLNLIPGRFSMGIVNTTTFGNRYLVFSDKALKGFSKYLDLYHLVNLSEFGVENANTVILENFIDSSSFPISMHRKIAAIDISTKDTVLMQEFMYVQKERKLIFSLFSYEDKVTRSEMDSKLREALKKMKNAVN